MDDMLVAMLNGLGAGVDPTHVNGLLLAPSVYNQSLYQAVVVIHNTAVKPVTSMVLSILATLMLASNASKIEADRELGVKIVAGTMFKIALVFIAAQSAVLILDAITEVGIAISQVAANTAVPAPAASTDLGDQLRPAIEAADAGMHLTMLVVLLLPFIVTQLANVLIIVLIFVFFLQLYMLTAFASLPIAFFGHEDTKQLGIGYLKRYASAVFTGVMLILAVKLYQALLGGWLSTALAVPGDVDLGNFLIDNFGAFFVAPIVLMFLLFGANQLAKAILGEG